MKLSYYYQEQIGCHPIIIAEVEKNYLKKLIWADKLHSDTGVMKRIIQLLSSMHNNSLITSHVFCKLELKQTFCIVRNICYKWQSYRWFPSNNHWTSQIWSDCCLMWLTFLVFSLFYFFFSFFHLQILCLGNFSTYFNCEYLQNQK